MSTKAVRFFADWQVRDHCSLCHCNVGLQTHHKIFRSQGGSDEEHNLARLCIVCHSAAHGIFANLDGHSCETCPVMARSGCYFGEKVLGRPVVSPYPWEDVTP